MLGKGGVVDDEEVPENWLHVVEDVKSFDSVAIVDVVEVHKLLLAGVPVVDGLLSVAHFLETSLGSVDFIN